jgi:hypothetical protein
MYAKLLLGHFVLNYKAFHCRLERLNIEHVFSFPVSEYFFRFFLLESSDL